MLSLDPEQGFIEYNRRGTKVIFWRNRTNKSNTLQKKDCPDAAVSAKSNKEIHL